MEQKNLEDIVKDLVRAVADQITSTENISNDEEQNAEADIAKVVAFALYKEQRDILQAAVNSVNARGGRVSASAALRWAIMNVDWNKLPVL